MIPKMLLTQMKKNSEHRNGSHLSPRLPSCGRRIWSRTNRMPSSPTFCMPRGTSFGLRKASQKNPITMMMLSRNSRPGLPNPTLPTLNSGVK